jgi:iron-sulfur cluster assembly protein
MSISLSETAAARIKNFIGERPEAVGLRLGVKRTGCSGYAYVINYAVSIDSNDQVFEDRGITIVVDQESLPLIDGTQVDFIRQGLNEAFRFKNPKAKGECGCGESFTP